MDQAPQSFISSHVTRKLIPCSPVSRREASRVRKRFRPRVRESAREAESPPTRPPEGSPARPPVRSRARPRCTVFPGLAAICLKTGHGLPVWGRLQTASRAGREAVSQNPASVYPALHEYESMSLVLSHNTAMLFHRASAGPFDRRLMLPGTPQLLKSGPVDMGKVDWARRLLAVRGVPEAGLESIDVSVLRDRDRRSGNGVVAHVWSYPIPPGALIEIDKGVYVASLPLCLQQVATELSELELIEFLLEACGRYALPPGSSDMVKRDPLTSVGELRKYCLEIKGQRGANKLRRALGNVRDGARSPMETAFFMMLILPRRLGGEGLTDLQMAHRIDVKGSARLLTKRSYFECDAFLPRSKTDIEYNGIIHEKEDQFVTDVERTNALEAMGYNVMTVTRRAFFDRASFGRAMNAIELRADRRSCRAPKDFAQKQEELRRFVLRRYLDEMPDDDRDVRLLAVGRDRASCSASMEVPWDYVPQGDRG